MTWLHSTQVYMKSMPVPHSETYLTLSVSSYKMSFCFNSQLNMEIAPTLRLRLAKVIQPTYRLHIGARLNAALLTYLLNKLYTAMNMDGLGKMGNVSRERKTQGDQNSRFLRVPYNINLFLLAVPKFFYWPPF